MATFYLGENGELTTQKKKKKKKKSSGVTYTLDKNGVLQSTEEDIAPVKTETKKKNGFFDVITSGVSASGVSQAITKAKGVDGYFKKSEGGVAETILGSSTDLMTNLVKGGVGGVEKAIDTFVGLAPAFEMAQKVSMGQMMTADDWAYRRKQEEEADKFAKKDLWNDKEVAQKILSGVASATYLNNVSQVVDMVTQEDFERSQTIQQEALNYIQNDAEKNSIFDEKSDALAESGGQLLTTAGLQAVGVPWWLTTGVTTFGGEYENALNSNATHDEAVFSGLVSAGAEVLTEKLSGGINFGSKTLTGELLDDSLSRFLSQSISNKLVRRLAKMGIDATGEGAEEVVTDLASRLGQKLSYESEKTWAEMFASEEAVESYIDSFIGGFAMGEIASGVRAVSSEANGVDFVTGNTANEQKVIDAETQKRIEESEKELKRNLKTSEKTKIRKKVQTEMERGELSTDTIESILGGETYEVYKSSTDEINSLKSQIEALQGNPKSSAQNKLSELKEKLRELEENYANENLKDKLSNEVYELTKNEKLGESYREVARKGQTYEADLTQYDAKQQEIIKRAIDSKILNNTRKTHDFVDWISRMSAEKGVYFDFANNESLKNSGFAIEGKTINGLVHNGEVILNVDSSKALNTVVGHEITHILEGSPELYNELQKSLKSLAEMKGEYQTRYDALAEIYKDVKDADIEKELTADLVGDYLFTDEEFIRNLSTEKPNLFKRIYEEIKYLCKMATTGSAEEKKLLEVKRTFEKLFKESGKANTDTKYSVSEGLEDIKAKYKDKTDHLYLHEKDNRLSIDNMVVKKEYRNQGIGSQILNDIIAYADKNGKTITLTPTSEYGTKEKLKKWYKSNGFVENKGRHTDFTFRDTMYRLPKSNTKYSLADSDGRNLTKEQQEYFKDSKVRDESGNLKVMYHGTERNDFTVFNGEFSDDGASLFFTDSPTVAKSYSASHSTYAPKKISSVEEANAEIEKDWNHDGYHIEQEGEDYVLYYESEEMERAKSLDEVFRAFEEGYGSGYGSSNYKVYLNLKKPLFVDAKGNYWDEIYKASDVDKVVYDTLSAKALPNGKISYSYYDNRDNRISGEMTEQEFEKTFGSKFFEDVMRNDGEFNTVRERLILDADTREEVLSTTRDYSKYAKAHGYDGVIFNNIVDNGLYASGMERFQPSTVAVAFEPNQIKSVENNAPTEDADIRYSLSEDSEGTKLSKEQQEYFKDAKTRDEEGKLKRYYHGTSRADRVVYYFNPERATSGPMAYFTDDKDIAGNYARDKADTSIAYDSEYDSYETQFRVERNGKNMSVVELWNTLSARERNAITEKAKHITMDDDWENVIFSEDAQYGLGNFDAYELNAHRGNALHTLVDSWLTDGNIYGEEQKFLDVLKLVGIEDAKYMNPDYREEKVYETYLNITNPFNTDSVDEKFLAEIYEWLDNTDLEQYSKDTANADMWDKNSIDPYAWAERVKGDIENGTAHAWTSVPDVITDFLKSKGYDGIFDIGGKQGGVGHQVVIPFYPNQIKDVTNTNPTIDDDIRYSLGEQTSPQGSYNVYGKDIALESALSPTETHENARKRTETHTTEEIAPTVSDESINERSEELHSKLKKKKGVYTEQGKIGDWSYYVYESASTNKKVVTWWNGEERFNDSHELTTSTEDALYSVTDFIANRELGNSAETPQNSAEQFRDATKMVDAPIREDAKAQESNRVTVAEQSLKAITRKAKRELGLGVVKGRELKQIIKEYGENADIITEDALYDIIKSTFGERTEAIRVDDVADAQTYLRKTRLKVSDAVKNGIDNFNDLRKSNFGKIRFNKDGLAIDEMYGELSSLYPDLFPIDVINQEDQFETIVDVANMSIEVYNTTKVDEPTLRRATDIIIDEVKHYANVQNDDVVQRKVALAQEKLDEALRVKETVHSSFNRRIAELQNKYEQTQDASLVKKIADIKRDRDSVDEEYDRKIGSLNEQIAKYNSPEFKTAQQRKAAQSKHADLIENLVGDTSTWVDKKLGLQYRVNTLRRNLRDIVRDASGNQDLAKADAIYDELQGKYNHNEAELKKESHRIKDLYAKLNITEAEDQYIQMLGEFRHNPDTELTKAMVEEFYEKNKDKIDTEKVDKVIEDARKTYDELIERVNEVLREQGMKEIPYRQGYFPHFTEEKQGFLAKLFNWKPINTEIPTDIAGLTEMFNPNRSWQSFNKQRKSDETDYSFMKGLDAYVHGSLDWIYHIEDIQKRRAFENHIRYVHSEAGVKERIDEINANENLDADETQAQIDAVYNEARNPLNNFVTDLRAGTNALANKKSSLDRGMEELTNRKMYSVMTNLSNRVTGNQVVGSISSALTNFIPITQSWGEVSPVSSLRAMGDVIRSSYKDDGMVEKSDFLTNRLVKEENLYRTFWDNVSDKAGMLMEVADSFTSQVVWRSKYLENMSNGMSEAEAIKNADQFAENVIAGRSRGNMPTIFESKNPLIKTLTAFQLEVNNQYGYMFKDMPQEMAEDNKAKLVKGYATMFIGAYCYNALYSSLTGRDAAFDPVGIIEDLLKDLFGDDDEEPTDAVMNLAENLLDEVPFVGGLMGGGRIPISSAMPYGEGLMEMFEGTMTDLSEGDMKNLTKEWLNPVYYLAMPTGGGQLKKTVQGLSMFSDEHPVSGSYTESGNLRFPVEDTLLNKVQAGLFGQYANKNARDYFDNNRSPLKEKQIQEYKDLELPIADYWEYREGLAEQETLEDKFEYIADLDLPVEKKNIMINNIVDRKEDVDMSNYDDFENYEEFDWYTKNTEKYDFLQENGISYQEYKADKETKEDYDNIYSWYKNNPEKVTLSKAVTDNVIEYKQYTSALNDIRADKDASGKSISGSAKEKKAAYIESLDLDYGQKIILYRSLYDSKADKEAYNMDIVDYLNSREDISYEEMKAILEELDFKVHDDGTITW